MSLHFTIRNLPADRLIQNSKHCLWTSIGSFLQNFYEGKFVKIATLQYFYSNLYMNYPLKRTSHCVHYIKQALIAVNIVIFYLARGHFIEQFLCTRNLCLLNRS